MALICFLLLLAMIVGATYAFVRDESFAGGAGWCVAIAVFMAYTTKL